MVSALCMSTRWTCLPAFTLLCTIPGIAALKVRAADSCPELAIGMMVATNTSADGAAEVMWSIRVDRRPGAPDTL